MRLLMRETRTGSPDGTTVITYQEGRTYNVPASLAEVFLREGWAEKPAHSAVSREKKITPPEEVKDYHVGGGWYQIDGEKVQGKEAARKLLE